MVYVGEGGKELTPGEGDQLGVGQAFGPVGDAGNSLIAVISVISSVEIDSCSLSC